MGQYKFLDKLSSFEIILGSGSPRRQYLLKELGLDFRVIKSDVDESFPSELKREEIPLYLCSHKADNINCEFNSNTLLITADTIVWVEGQVLNKPESDDDAKRMLRLLSGKMHEVITGVCLRSADKKTTFYSVTKVFFKQLNEDEIDFYVEKYQPYDKAGSYGAQEWIGYIAVERIEGSYFNVMGLPIKEVYEQMLKF